MVGPLLVHLHQPLEVVLVAGRFVDDQLAFLVGGGIGRILPFAFGSFRRQIGIVLLQIEHGIFLDLLLDPLLQGQDRQLQNLHRLDHPRRQNLFLHHPQVLTERKSHSYPVMIPPTQGRCGVLQFWIR